MSTHSAKAGYVAVGTFMALAMLAAVALATRQPFVFPSLGPTAFMLFYSPGRRDTGARVTIVGHTIGIACGYAGLVLTGLTAQEPNMLAIDNARLLACSIALASTGAFMILFRAVHPPAGATTLIIALGLLSAPLHLAIMLAAVCGLVLIAGGWNRVARRLGWQPGSAQPEAAS